MQLIRQFEMMAEEKYKMEGKIRGFFHAYVEVPNSSDCLAKAAGTD